MQTRDYRQLPGNYGMGSGTLAKWIQQHMDEDANNANNASAKIGEATQATNGNSDSTKK